MGSGLCFEQKRCFKTKYCSCSNGFPFKFHCSNNEGDLSVEILSNGIIIDCTTYNNGIDNEKLLDIIPKMNESYISEDFDFSIDSCVLPYKFSTISEKFPPIKTAKFYVVEAIQNVSKDFFDENSPITDLDFNDPIVFASVNMLRNLKNLQNVNITLENEIFHGFTSIPQNLLEGNINLKICRIYLKNSIVKLPSKLFYMTDALEQATILFDFNNVLEDGLFSNKKNLVFVMLESIKRDNAAISIPSKTFRNSTNLTDIVLENLGLTKLDP